MPTYNNNRPDPVVLAQLLQDHLYDPAGRVLRLALWAGLTRKEIVALQWHHVHPTYLEVDHRKVPLSPELASYLQHAPNQINTHVVTSTRNRVAMSPQSVSHMMGQLLDQAGLTEVRLADLRGEYIIQALQTTPWKQVCHNSGMRYTSLRENFQPYLREKISLLEEPKENTVLDPHEMQTILDKHDDPSISLAMGLAWHMGITLQEMLDLTWDDFHSGAVHIERGAIPLAPWVHQHISDRPSRVGHVLVGPKSGKPLLPERVSRLVRQAMLSHGVHHVTLRDLVADHQHRENGGHGIVAYLQTHEKTTTAQIARDLGMPHSLVYKQLTRLCQQKQVVKVGALYYLPHCVAHPELHQELVLEHLDQYGRLYRKDVVELLGITANQASVLLQKWVRTGWLVQEKQSYSASS